LRNLGTGIIWLHNSKLRRRDGHFDEFEAWSDGILADEAVALHKMDRRIASETKWSREGISARRKRNQGRLRELAGMRAERAKAGGLVQRTMRMETGPADGGGQLVLEAIDLCVSVPITQHGAKEDDTSSATEQSSLRAMSSSSGRRALSVTVRFAGITQIHSFRARIAGVDPAQNTKNPYVYMTGEERVKWSKLWEAVDAMQGRGVRFLQNAWYGGDPGMRLDEMEKKGKIPADWR
jgi:hypothetical protein